MAKERPKKKTKKKPTKAGTGSSKVAARGSRERVRPPETRDVGAHPETPKWLLPPRVSWRNDSHRQEARGPKRVVAKIERIAKRVWRNIPDRERTVIGLAPHDIFLVNGPVGEESPGGRDDDVSNTACWHEKLGILINVAGETVDPRAEKRFTYAVAHELAHVYLKSASFLVHAGASMLPGVEGFPKSQIPRVGAIAAAYGTECESDREAEELMVTALAISWGFGPEYLVSWLAAREGKA